MLCDEAFGQRWFYATPYERRQLILDTIRAASGDGAAALAPADQEFPNDENAWTWDKVFDMVRRANGDKWQYLQNLRAAGTTPEKAFQLLIEKIKDSTQTDAA